LYLYFFPPPLFQLPVGRYLEGQAVAILHLEQLALHHQLLNAGADISQAEAQVLQGAVALIEGGDSATTKLAEVVDNGLHLVTTGGQATDGGTSGSGGTHGGAHRGGHTGRGDVTGGATHVGSSGGGGVGTGVQILGALVQAEVGGDDVHLVVEELVQVLAGVGLAGDLGLVVVDLDVTDGADVLADGDLLEVLGGVVPVLHGDLVGTIVDDVAEELTVGHTGGSTVAPVGNNTADDDLADLLLVDGEDTVTNVLSLLQHLDADGADGGTGPLGTLLGGAAILGTLGLTTTSELVGVHIL